MALFDPELPDFAKWMIVLAGLIVLLLIIYLVYKSYDRKEKIKSVSLFY